MRRLQYVVTDGDAEKDRDDGRHRGVRKLRKDFVFFKRLARTKRRVQGLKFE
jgi:hypothetical protein